ncbi:MAG TPA: hypothetical protein VII41_03750 [Steroidobacteraceae bacterium]
MLASLTRHLLRCAVCLGVHLALASALQVATAASDAQHSTWVALAGTELDPRARAALAQIRGADRRLLALRAYLRAGAALQTRWSWTQAQIAAYASTPEGIAAAADIEAVAAAFAAANPGFTLHVNRMPRSLELQIAHWNDNRSVGSTATALVSALDRQLGTHAGAPDPASLRSALINWAPSRAAALAAPGLSAHGQARAFDFQVERSGQVVAGLDAASARQQWDAAGWTQRLHAAVDKAGGRFSGPLAQPYEPWHYAYTAR